MNEIKCTQNFLIKSFIKSFGSVSVSDEIEDIILSVIIKFSCAIILYYVNKFDGKKYMDKVYEIDGEMQDCSICHESLQNHLVKTECNHYFHENCLETWLVKKPNCPLCRKDIKI